jgi:hypothetical protein
LKSRNATEPAPGRQLQGEADGVTPVGFFSFGLPLTDIQVFAELKQKTWMAGTSSVKTRFALLSGHVEKHPL